MADFDFSIPFNRAKDNMLTDLSSKYCAVMSATPFFKSTTSEYFASMDKEQKAILLYFEKIMKRWIEGDEMDDMLNNLVKYAYLISAIEVGDWVNNRTDADREFMVNRCFLARRCVVEFWEQINKYYEELKEDIYD